MNIIGFYSVLNIALAEKDGKFLVVDRQDKKVLYAGDHETALKTFVMIMAGFIEKGILSQ